MKIEITEPLILKQFAKASDMACCLFELKLNLWRKWKHSDKSPTGEEVLDEMYRIIDKFNIDVEDLNN